MLISAGPRYTMRLLARALNIRYVITSWPNIVHGRVSGMKGVRVLSNEGKSDAAREFCEKHGVAPDDCWAYGDSTSDKDLLAFVGHPVAVNPKRALAKIARKQEWAIVQWRTIHTVPSVSLSELPPDASFGDQ